MHVEYSAGQAVQGPHSPQVPGHIRGHRHARPMQLRRRGAVDDHGRLAAMSRAISLVGRGLHDVGHPVMMRALRCGRRARRISLQGLLRPATFASSGAREARTSQILGRRRVRPPADLRHGPSNSKPEDSVAGSRDSACGQPGTTRPRSRWVTVAPCPDRAHTRCAVALPPLGERTMPARKAKGQTAARAAEAAGAASDAVAAAELAAATETEQASAAEAAAGPVDLADAREELVAAGSFAALSDAAASRGARRRRPGPRRSRWPTRSRPVVSSPLRWVARRTATAWPWRASRARCRSRQTCSRVATSGRWRCSWRGRAISCGPSRMEPSAARPKVLPSHGERSISLGSWQRWALRNSAREPTSSRPPRSSVPPATSWRHQAGDQPPGASPSGARHARQPKRLATSRTRVP